eukprot:jgi/Mesen1/6510/ME000332S05518
MDEGGASWRAGEGEDEGNFGEDFGQKVDLTQRIREVLANYPEGTTILKELIQNADDAILTLAVGYQPELRYVHIQRDQIQLRKLGTINFVHHMADVAQCAAYITFATGAVHKVVAAAAAPTAEYVHASVAFCLDRRQHGTQSLAYSCLAQFQGPALLVHNNGVFSEDDFESISRVGNSKKRSQAWKTGRFGVGFNSVYHLSDLPSFVSSRFVVFLDPHCKFLPRLSAANPGKRVDFVARPVLPSHADQFKPYCAFGCNMERAYAGTLFRFPLHTEAQAPASQLSKQSEAMPSLLFLKHVEVVEIYDWPPLQGSPSKLFQCRIESPLRRCAATGRYLPSEAMPSLLFLKHVEVVEIYDWPPLQGSPSKLFQCRIESPLRRCAATGSSTASQGNVASNTTDVFKISFASRALASWQSLEHLAGGPLEPGAKGGGEGGGQQPLVVETFLVSQSMGQQGSRIASMVDKAAKEYDLYLLPWVSVAARIAGIGGGQSPGPNAAPSGGQPLEGLAFCFLPLPVKTGLPVHVNGYFELSSNRRDIWYGDDMDRGGSLRSEWNKYLLEGCCQPRLCPPTPGGYFGSPSPSYYSLLPVGALSQPWSNMVSTLYSSLCRLPVLHTPQGAPCGRWIEPARALYHDEQFSDSDALEQALLREGLLLVRLPPPVREMLFCLTVDKKALAVVTPSYVRAHLRSPAPQEHHALAERGLALVLLEYCLSDISNDVAAECLTGLQLVPLADSHLGWFGPHEEGKEIVYAADERQYALLTQGGAAHRTVDVAGLSRALLERLGCIARRSTGGSSLLSQPDAFLELMMMPISSAALCSALARTGGNLCLLNAKLLYRLMPLLMPPGWRGQDDEWLGLLWEVLRANCADLASFSDWPLLPVDDRHLCVLDRAHSRVLRGSGWDVVFSVPDGSGVDDQTPTLPGAEVTTASGDRGVAAAAATNAAGGDVLTGLLRKVGCKLLRSDIPAIEHAQLRAFVHDASAAGLLDALLSVTRRCHVSPVELLSGLTDGERKVLRTFLYDARWYAGNSMTRARVEVFRSLSIFESYGPAERGSTAPREGTSFAATAARAKESAPCVQPPSVFSSLAGRGAFFLAPEGADEALLGPQFLKCASERESSVLTGPLGVPRLSRASFYKIQVLARLQELPAETRDRTMLAILQELPQLCGADSSMREAVVQLAFVPIDSGRGGPLRRLQDLYDPWPSELQALLEDRDWFPGGPFGEPEVLDMLQGVGLRTAVTAETVLQSGRTIEKLLGGANGRDEGERVRSRGQALLAYLEGNAARWVPGGIYLRSSGAGGNSGSGKLGETGGADTGVAKECGRFWAELANICWCPVLLEPPVAGLPWPPPGSFVAPPPVDTWLVSASLRILDAQCHSAALASRLGWSQWPGGNILAAQLLELGKMDISAVPKIYSLLTQMLGSEEMPLVRAVLEGGRWVWVGDSFCLISECALTGPLQLAPYLRIIPADLASFRELLMELGVRDSLTPSEYAHVLKRMAEDAASNPLDGHQLAAAVGLVQHLADMHFGTAGEDHTGGQGIFMPDKQGVLAPAGDLVFNDAPWLADDPAGLDGMLSNAPTGTNMSLRALLLAESADSMDLGLHSLGEAEAEAFGQHEALTTRLKHIVEMYADGPGILSELVQNADDAGASRVSFLLDRCQHGTSSVLSRRMEAWQGPALYCFNDAEFSPRDLHAISRIGQDSKLERPSAIGRFDLGFNSVYHFTDVPAFVSGQTIVILDPHARHLPAATPSHPGLKIGFVGRGLVERFPDQFRPYQLFGCDLQRPFPGTLFRFPFRTAATAGASEIKPEAYLPAGMTELIASFQPIAEEALLFLRNIGKISVYTRDELGQDLQLLYKIKRSRLSATQATHPGAGKGHMPLFKFVLGDPRNPIDKEQFYSKLQRTADGHLPWFCGQVEIKTTTAVTGDGGIKEKSVTQWLGPPASLPSLLKMCLGGIAALLEPQGGDDDAEEQQEEGTIQGSPAAASAARSAAASSSSSKAGPSRIARSAQRRSSFEGAGGQRSGKSAIAIAGASNAQELVSRGKRSWMQKSRAAFEGRAFCFLPLPVKIGLPVHVNGYFELSSNRGDIWYGDDMTGGGKLRASWNKCLLEDVADPAYARLLVEAARALGPTAPFYAKWPVDGGHLAEPWALLAKRVYTAVVELNLPVLFTEAGGGRWIVAKRAIFSNFEFAKWQDLEKALVQANLPVVNLPPAIMKMFAQACPGFSFLSPQLLRKALRGSALGLGGKENVTDALTYCLSYVAPQEASEKLQGLALLPLANGSLGTFYGSVPGEAFYGVKYLLLGSQEEHKLLSQAVPEMLVDWDLEEGGKVWRRLKEIAVGCWTNLRVLTAGVLEELMPRLLPPSWRGRECVEWSPGAEEASGGGRQPGAEWLQLFWRYLVTCSTAGGAAGGLGGSLSGRRSHAVDLSVLAEWPILPVSGGQLRRLLPAAPVLRDGGWSEHMSALLSRAHCYPLSPDLPLEPPQLTEFMFPATAVGILDSLVTSAHRGERAATGWPYELLPPGATEVAALLGGASDGERRELRSFLCQSKWFGPSGGLTDAHLEDAHFAEAVAELKFVPTQRDGLEVPSRLYNSRVPNLSLLLDKQFIPADAFSTPEVLDALVGLGLQHKVGPKGLLDSARSVEFLAGVDEPEAARRARALLAYLDELLLAPPADGSMRDRQGAQRDNTWHGAGAEGRRQSLAGSEDPHLSSASGSTPANQGQDGRQQVQAGAQEEEEKVEEGTVGCGEFGPSFWRDLSDILWCPVVVKSPHAMLPWGEGHSSMFAPPKLVRPPGDMWLVSASMRLLAARVRSPALYEGLLWCAAPSTRVLAVQLVELSRTYLSRSHRQGRASGGSGGSGGSSSEGGLLGRGLTEDSREDFALEGILAREVARIYQCLQEAVPTPELEAAREVLQGRPWVWVGNAFVAPEELAFDSPAHFHPYLHAVPSEIAAYRSLLTALGVKEAFDAEDCAGVLLRLAQDVGSKKLSQEHLNFAMRVLKTLTEVVPAGSSSQGAGLLGRGEVLMPDAAGVLAPAKDLAFNDATWLADVTKRRLVHKDVPIDLAERLGARSLRHLMSFDQEMTNNLQCLPAGTIAKLLDIWQDRDHLLFDLLEVAEDVGAKRMEVVYDQRHHSTQSLLDSNLSQFQGPSLTVMLDGATLSTNEICLLLQPASAKLRGTACHYGNGLLGAYHFTDVPFIVSASGLHLFDPLGKTLGPSSATGGTASTGPAAGGRSSGRGVPVGKAYKLEGSATGTDLPQQFLDQFEPFNVGLTKTCAWTRGTIVRLPLRTPWQAQRIEICSRVASVEDEVLAVLEILREHAAPTLLHLSSVELILISTWADSKPAPQEIFSCQIDATCAARRNPFLSKKWCKFHVPSFFGGVTSPDKVQFIDVKVREGPDNPPSVDKWLVVQSLGTGHMRDLARDRRYLPYNLTPVASVAAQILRNGSMASPPLPMSTMQAPLPLLALGGFPVTISGSFLPIKGEGGRGLFSSQPPLAAPPPPLGQPTPPGASLTSQGPGLEGGAVRPTSGSVPATKRSELVAGAAAAARVSPQEHYDLSKAIELISGTARLTHVGGDATSQALRANWNKKLLECTCDAYTELLLELARMRGAEPKLVRSKAEPLIGGDLGGALDMPAEQMYSYWPRSAALLNSLSVSKPSLLTPATPAGPARRAGATPHLAPGGAPTGHAVNSGEASAPVPLSLHGAGPPRRGQHWSAEVQAITEGLIKPLYVKLAELPLWLLNGGGMGKAHEAMFLALPGEMGCCEAPLEAVGRFLHAHHKVFDLPWELACELEGAGVAVQQFTPRMLRALLRALNTADLNSDSEAQLDLLEYCCADICREAAPSSPPGLPQQRQQQQVPLGRNISSLPGGGPVAGGAHRGAPELLDEFATFEVDTQAVGDLNGVPVPTAASSVARLGTGVLLLATPQQQSLLPGASSTFVHSGWTSRPGLLALFLHPAARTTLLLKPFSPQELLWVHWLRTFWTYVDPHKLALFNHWPLIPAVTSGAMLVPVKHRELVFVPPAASELPPGAARADVASSVPPGALDATQRATSAAPPSGSSRAMGRFHSREKEGRNAVCPPKSEPGPSASSDEEEEEKDQDGRFEELERSHPWLMPLLRRLGVPVFDRWFLDTRVLVSCSPPAGRSLPQLRLRGLHLATPVAPAEAELLLILLASPFRTTGPFSAAQVSPYTGEEAALIRSLPIFRTVQGAQVALDLAVHCIVPPGAFLHPESTTCLLHRPAPEIAPLFQAVGVPTLADKDVLTRFALPGFGGLTKADQKRTLSYVLVNWHSLREDEALKSALKEARFVLPGCPAPAAAAAAGCEAGWRAGARAGAGAEVSGSVMDVNAGEEEAQNQQQQQRQEPLQRVRPTDLMDPHKQLLRQVYGDEPARCPGGEFASSQWLAVLRDAGLRTSMDAATLLECARKVESLSHHQHHQQQSLRLEGERGGPAARDGEGWENFNEEELSTSGGRGEARALARVDARGGAGALGHSGAAAETILGNFAAVFDRRFCEQLSRIRFVPAHRGIPSGSRGDCRVLTLYSHVLLHRDWPLAWTCTPVIARASLVPPEFAWRFLQIQSPPPFAAVLGHLKKVGASGDEDVLARWPNAVGMRSVNDVFGDVLRHQATIWDSQSLADLTPLVFELPSGYLSHSNMLASLGMQERPSVGGMRALLQEMQRRRGQQHLNPNELRAVLHMLSFICTDVDNRDRAVASTQVDQLAGLAHESVVPDDRARLVAGLSCVYVDPSGARLLCNIDTDRVRFAHPRVQEKACGMLGVRKLSHVVIEELDEQAVLEHMPEIQEKPLSAVAQHLASAQLQDAVWAVVEEHAKVVLPLKGLSHDAVMQTLSRGAGGLKFVRNLHTRFLLLPSRIDITIRARTSSLPHSKRSFIYVAEPPSHVPLSGLLASVVSRLLGSPLVLPLGALLECPPGSELLVRRTLRLGLPGSMSNSDQEMTPGTAAGQACGLAATSGIPGMDVLTADLAIIQCHPLRPLHAGEVVVWRVDSSSEEGWGFVWGTVDSDRRDRGHRWQGSSSESSGSSGKQLKYGRVVQDVKAPAGQALYRMQVETGPGEVWLLPSSAIFFFKASMVATASTTAAAAASLPSTSEASSSCSPGEEGPRGGNSMGQLSDQTPSGSNGQAATSAADRVVTPGMLAAPAAGVPAAEVAQAVRDMLAAAGIPVDLAQMDLLQKTLALQEQVAAVDGELSSERLRANTATQEADGVRTAWQCRICISQEISMVLVPCGHALCTVCLAAVNKCPFCRKAVTKALRLYNP